MDLNGKNRMIIPAGRKCVACGGPMPCIMHSQVAFRRVDGTDLVFENIPACLSAVMQKLDDLEGRLKRALL